MGFLGVWGGVVGAAGPCPCRRLLDCMDGDARLRMDSRTDAHTLRLARGMGALAVLHLLVGAMLGLSVDEAHYALYATHPALSYFDHPPLVGWVQWPLVQLGGATPLLRLLPGALWLLAVWMVYRMALLLAVRAGQEPATQAIAARWAVLACALAPLLHVLGLGLVPDTLLMVLHLALMWQTLRMMDSVRPSPWQWLLLGVLLGLAGLAKYTAIFSALAVAVCLWAVQGRALFRQRGLWLAAVVALLIASPVFVWNAQNQWVSFAYQGQHGSGGAWQAVHLMRFVLVQCLAYGPLILWGLWGQAALRRSPQRWTIAFFLLPFAVMAALSGGGTSLPHWTAPAMLSLAPLAGLGLARMVTGGRKALATRLVQGLALLQALACGALVLVMLTAGMPFMAGKAASASATDPPNPFADLLGWDNAGRRASELAKEHGITSLSVQNWTLASRLAWYARPLPVHVLADRFDQFDLWWGDLPAGGDTLLVDWSQLPYELPLGAHGFVRCEPLDALPVKRLGYTVATFYFHHCQAWAASPMPRLRAAGPETPEVPGRAP